MLVIKTLSFLALLVSIIWFLLFPDFGPAIAIVTSLATLIWALKIIGPDLGIDVIKELIPKWSPLKKLENNNFVKSSFVWFMIVPIVSRLLEKINDTIVLTYNNQEYTINLSLPFSWQLFFYSACFFTAGNIFVKLFCPEVIKEHSSFKDFEESGKSWPQINQYIIDLYYDNLTMRFPKKNHDSVNDYLNYFHNKDLSSSQKYDHDVVIFLKTNRFGENENYAYWFAYNGAEYISIIKRFITTIFYSIGFFLLSIVAYQNLLFVIQTTNVFNT